MGRRNGYINVLSKLPVLIWKQSFAGLWADDATMLQVETSICTVKKGKKLICLVFVRYNSEYSDGEKQGKNELEFTEKNPNVCMYLCINDKIY